MAWKLRQSVEGDRIVTVQNVANDATGFCWSNANGQYIPGTIAIKIDGIEYILNSVASLGFGFLFIRIPDNIYIKANTSVQVYAKCTSNPEYITSILQAKPVNFQLTSETITTCDPRVNLNATADEYLRLFLGVTQGSYSLINLENSSKPDVAFVRSEFDFQPGDSGNIDFNNSVITRNTVGTENTTLFSKIPYNGNSNLNIIPTSQLYHTIRFGNIEIIFDYPSVRYINYTSTNNTEVYLTNYEIATRLEFISSPSSYQVFKDNNLITPILNIPKNVTWSASGGTIFPATGLLGTPVEWTKPTIAGNYEITVTVNQNIKYSKTITIHSCGTAVTDNFTGAFNESFTGNVSLNDQLCLGEENRVIQAIGSSVVGGTLVSIEPNGQFTFLPNNGFTGTANFQYSRLCGSNGNYETVGTATVNIKFECASVLPEWEDTGIIQCINCIPHKQQKDLNRICSGSSGYQWVVDNNDSCNYDDQWVDTNETKCEFGHLWRKQINLNDCDPNEQEKWIDLGISTECECLGEVFINSCCSKGVYYPIVKVLEYPNEENRAIEQCLYPDLDSHCLVNKPLKFKSLNDGLPHTYVITLFDCNWKIISQIKLENFNCAGNSSTFNYIFNFNL